MDANDLPGYNSDGSLTDERLQFAMDFANCMLCGQQATDTHEIARGAHRKKAVKQRCAWLRLCRMCHEAMGNYAEWPIARQLALKKQHDPVGYNRIALNRLRGRADESVAEHEVDRYLYRR